MELHHDQVGCGSHAYVTQSCAAASGRNSGYVCAVAGVVRGRRNIGTECGAVQGRIDFRLQIFHART